MENPKTGEYKYHTSSSRTRKVNIGNFENIDYFESQGTGTDDIRDLPKLQAVNRATVTARVEAAMQEDIDRGIIRQQLPEFKDDTEEES